MSGTNDIAQLEPFLGNVLTPSITTHLTSKRLMVPFIDRVENYLMHVIDRNIRTFYLNPRVDTLLRDKANLSIPSVNTLRMRSELVLLNYDPLIDTPEQLPAAVIGVGGLQIVPAKPLPEVIFQYFVK